METNMRFSEAYKTCFKKYATFKGRARRKEYWYFVLFVFLISLAIGFVSGFIVGLFDLDESFITVCSAIVSLAVLLPSLAVQCRRLHDTGKSGWLLLLYLVPLAGAIAMFVFMCLKGNEGPNEYGPDPKRAAAPAARSAEPAPAYAAPAAPAPAAAFCTNCGAKLSEGDIFCTNCGTKVR